MLRDKRNSGMPETEFKERLKSWSKSRLDCPYYCHYFPISGVFRLVMRRAEQTFGLELVQKPTSTQWEV